ncbi:hypothetical protein GP486_000238, partial [Trichoglossum hirsutum]
MAVKRGRGDLEEIEALIMGEFSILASSGVFSVMGATLRGGAHVTVSAPLCHSLPIIECLSTEPSGASEIKIQHHNSGIRSLHRAVPLFKHMWGGDPRVPLDKQRSFTTLRSGDDIPGHWKYEVKTLDLSESWKQLICELTESIKKEALPVIAAAGPKSAGKSTFCRHLYNSILTNPTTSNGNDGVAFLDLDPGQPEFSPPGQVSLFHLRSPLLGPPFSHAGLINDNNRLVRSHHIGHNTPENNPDHYVACAVDLFAQYRKLVPRHPACPLIINTAGWVKAAGLEILTDLLRQSLTTHLVWFTSEPSAGGEDSASLRRASEGISVRELPSQPARPTSRTPADLRAMQTLSYLHLSPGLNMDADRQEGHGLQWDATPLTHQVPWVVEYSGPTPGILGIMILEETLPTELLTTAINGTIVAVVVIEDDDALPTTTTNGDQKAKGRTGSNRKEKQPSQDLAIDRDPATNLPYIRTPDGAPLDPTKTSCAGLALIRGIDTANQALHLITPIDPSRLPPGKNVVLVRGRAELS